MPPLPSWLFFLLVIKTQTLWCFDGFSCQITILHVWNNKYASLWTLIMRWFTIAIKCAFFPFDVNEMADIKRISLFYTQSAHTSWLCRRLNLITVIFTHFLIKCMETWMRCSNSYSLTACFKASSELLMVFVGKHS